jgi:hypothetical protein
MSQSDHSTGPGNRALEDLDKVNIRYLHKVNLIADPWHPACLNKPVLRIVGTGQIMDAAMLRKDPEAKTITDYPETVCRLLGLAFPDEQVVKER